MARGSFLDFFLSHPDAFWETRAGVGLTQKEEFTKEFIKEPVEFTKEFLKEGKSS